MKNKFIYYTAIIFFLKTAQLTAAPKVIISGVIIDSSTRKPVEFATVGIAELKLKVFTDSTGAYKLEVPPGSYTILINSPGLANIREPITIDKNITRNFDMKLPTVAGRGFTIQAERDIQKISRYTVKKEEIKAIPATFGDSLNAVATMAGIERQGFVGSLAIRGMSSSNNRYYVDGIPIGTPQHFGGLHSVIHNEMISEIDIFSSAFPVQYGAPLSSVIEFNTTDEVKEFYGYSDIGILSANLFVAQPIFEKQNQALLPDSAAATTTGQGSSENNSPAEKKTKGYVMASARYGYISLIAPRIVKAFGGDSIAFDIYYYDYQFKTKYYLHKNHALTLLLTGATDYVYAKANPDQLTFQQQVDKGQDPLLLNFTQSNDETYHVQGLTYSYIPSDKLTNKLKIYSSYKKAVRYVNIDDARATTWKDINTTSAPWILGVKNDMRWSLWKDHLVAKAGVEANHFQFRAYGKTIKPAKLSGGTNGPPNFADTSAFSTAQIDQNSSNGTTGGYLETSWKFAGFELTPGVRTDYLLNQKLFTIDPRGRAGYTAPTDTTFSVAGGTYSSFFQTNYYYYDNSPDIINADLKPEKATHRSLGIEQRFSELVTFKIEGYKNNFHDIVEIARISTPTGTIPAINLGERRTYGIEVTLKKEFGKQALDYFGWISYTYGKSEHKSNLPDYADPQGYKWIPGNYDRRHSFKAIAGIKYKKNTLGLKFQYYTSFPYTPIVGTDTASSFDNTASNPMATPPYFYRYAPLYGDRYSKFYKPQHQLDIRYSREASYKWGAITWYIEILNVYNQKADDRESWKYNKPYQKGQNPQVGSTQPFAILPNLGVEIKF